MRNSFIHEILQILMLIFGAKIQIPFITLFNAPLLINVQSWSTNSQKYFVRINAPFRAKHFN